MRKIFVSEENLKKIVDLRKSGAGWTAIEDATGIKRRRAQKAYEENENSKSEKQIVNVRNQVASEFYKAHIEDLIAMAEIIPTILQEPEPTGNELSQSIIDQLMQKPIRAKDGAMLSSEKNRAGIVKRHNHLLFESLKQHARDEKWSRALNDWQIARNRWQTNRSSLIQTATSTINNYLAIYKDSETRVIKVARSLSGDMPIGIVKWVCRSVLDGKSIDLELNDLKSKSGDIQLAQFIRTRLDIKTKAQGGKLLQICTQTIDVINKAHNPTVNAMKSSLEAMRASKITIEDELNELKITPIILRTKCDICPVD